MTFPEFDDHRVVSFLSSARVGLRAFVALHRVNHDVPAFGATRLVAYPSEEAALRDALKLSRLMSYKAAIAGIKYGGAKGVIIKPDIGHNNKEDLLRSYAEKLNYFNGRFITGADVGVDHKDVATMAEVSPFCIGFTNHPAKFTALGILYSIQVCLQDVFGSSDLSSRSFAIQGVGKVGAELLSLLHKKAKRIFIADINPERISQVKKMYPEVEVVPPEEIHRQEADVFSPCALSSSLNLATIQELRCKMIVGGANNQLEDEHIGVLLNNKLGILYAPDYVVNAGGLISVVDEYENKKADLKRIENRVQKIKLNLQKILEDSKSQHKATNLVANQMAEAIFNNP